MTKKHFTSEDAKSVGESLGIDWSKFEHGTVDANTNVSNDDPIVTGKIALAHLNEFPDYYTRLYKMEKEADEFWGKD